MFEYSLLLPCSEVTISLYSFTYFRLFPLYHNEPADDRFLSHYISEVYLKHSTSVTPKKKSADFRLPVTLVYGSEEKFLLFTFIS